jgi:hypothetical protein
VDVVDWPYTVERARPLLMALPASLSGRTAHRAGGYVVYDSEYATVQVEDVARAARMFGSPERRAGPLASYADLVSCDRTGVAGTAPVGDRTSTGGANGVWFACHVTKNGDQPEAQVVGWTSGAVIWFAMAPSTSLLTTLITPLVTAASALPGDGPGTRATIAPVTAPYGIEQAAWPLTLSGAARLGARLDALEGRGADGQGESLMAEYPSGDVFMVAAKRSDLSSAMMLAASFGLMYTCGRGTFEGTAPMIEGAGTAAQPPPGTDVRWFTCEVKGSEGDPSFRGHAVGWTSGPLAWLLIGRDEQRAKALMTALADAASQAP